MKPQKFWAALVHTWYTYSLPLECCILCEPSSQKGHEHATQATPDHKQHFWHYILLKALTPFSKLCMQHHILKVHHILAKHKPCGNWILLCALVWITNHKNVISLSKHKQSWNITLKSHLAILVMWIKQTRNVSRILFWALVLFSLLL